MHLSKYYLLRVFRKFTRPQARQVHRKHHRYSRIRDKHNIFARYIEVSISVAFFVVRNITRREKFQYLVALTLWLETVSAKKERSGCLTGLIDHTILQKFLIFSRF